MEMYLGFPILAHASVCSRSAGIQLLAILVSPCFVPFGGLMSPANRGTLLIAMFVVCVHGP